MSARRRRQSRRATVPYDPAEALDLWCQAAEIRTEWLSHALCTASADRGAAQDAIAGLYALLGQPRPRFVWVDSPAAVTGVLPPTVSAPRSDAVQPLESRLATLMSALRHRLDHRTRPRHDPYAVPAPHPPDPVAALRSGASLHSVVDTGVGAALRRVVHESVAGLVRAELPPLGGLTWYGQHDAGWVAYYDVHRRILGARYSPADSAQLDLWAELARTCGWWWPRQDVCVVAERPTAIRTEAVPGSGYAEVRLHEADGPAVAFPDGWTVHSWHGTRVPSWVIDGPTADLIAGERNAEVRRCAIERIGWAAYIEQAGLALLGRAPDPGNPGSELRLYDLPGAGWAARTRLLLAVNGSVERDGTRRRYGLHVPPWFDDPVDAAGWSYGLTGAQYAQLQRRT